MRIALFCRWGFGLVLSGLLFACASTPVKKNVDGDGFEKAQMLQSDANRIANLAMRDNLAGLSVLLEKFYRRNPSQWKKTAASPEAARFAVMEALRTQQPLPGLDDKKSIEAMSLAFDPYFHGDRAAALVYGVGTMLLEVWGGRTEHYMLHGLDAQKLMNASYNIEMVAWMLATRVDEKGQPYLLSNELSSAGRNLSFEREFSKMMGRLELLAESTDEKYRRAGINYVQGLVGAPLLQFIPVGAVSSALP